jgi:hypothetical protein
MRRLLCPTTAETSSTEDSSRKSPDYRDTRNAQRCLSLWIQTAVHGSFQFPWDRLGSDSLRDIDMSVRSEVCLQLQQELDRLLWSDSGAETAPAHSSRAQRLCADVTRISDWINTCTWWLNSEHLEEQVTEEDADRVEKLSTIEDSLRMMIELVEEAKNWMDADVEQPGEEVDDESAVGDIAWAPLEEKRVQVETEALTLMQSVHRRGMVLRGLLDRIRGRLEMKQEDLDRCTLLRCADTLSRALINGDNINGRSPCQGSGELVHDREWQLLRMRGVMRLFGKASATSPALAARQRMCVEWVQNLGAEQDKALLEARDAAARGNVVLERITDQLIHACSVMDSSSAGKVETDRILDDLVSSLSSNDSAAHEDGVRLVRLVVQGAWRIIGDAPTEMDRRAASIRDMPSNSGLSDTSRALDDWRCNGLMPTLVQTMLDERALGERMKSVLAQVAGLARQVHMGQFRVDQDVPGEGQRPSGRDNHRSVSSMIEWVRPVDIASPSKRGSSLGHSPTGRNRSGSAVLSKVKTVDNRSPDNRSPEGCESADAARSITPIEATWRLDSGSTQRWCNLSAQLTEQERGFMQTLVGTVEDDEPVGIQMLLRSFRRWFTQGHATDSVQCADTATFSSVREVERVPVNE